MKVDVMANIRRETALAERRAELAKVQHRVMHGGSHAATAHSVSRKGVAK